MDTDLLKVRIMMIVNNSSLIPPQDRHDYVDYISSEVHNNHQLPHVLFTHKDLVNLLPKDRNGYPRKYYKYAYDKLPILEYIYLTFYTKNRK